MNAISPPPWFDPADWSWLPGAAVGLCAGLIGVLAGAAGRRARVRPWAIGFVFFAVALALALLVAGLAAKIMGQPFAIWYAFMFPGLLGLLAFSLCLGPVRRKTTADMHE